METKDPWRLNTDSPYEHIKDRPTDFKNPDVSEQRFDSYLAEEYPDINFTWKTKQAIYNEWSSKEYIFAGFKYASKMNQESNAENREFRKKSKELADTLIETNAEYQQWISQKNELIEKQSEMIEELLQRPSSPLPPISNN